MPQYAAADVEELKKRLYRWISAARELGAVSGVRRLRRCRTGEMVNADRMERSTY